MSIQEQKQQPVAFFIIDYSTGGGVERVTANLMQQFYDRGFQNLHLISLKPKLKTSVMQYPDLKYLKILESKKFSTELSDYLLKNKIKHLIFQGDNMTIALEVLKAAKIAQCKAYPQYHGSPYAYLKKYPDALKSNYQKILFAQIVYPFKKNKLKKFINNSEQGIFCVSEGSAKELKTIFNNSKKINSKINVIRNPILLEDFKGFEKEKKVTLASRLESKHKNAFLAVKAWEIISDQFPDWTLVILGDGYLMQKMIDFCSEKKIKNVIFKGFVNDVNSELATSSVSLSVSNCEGFPMSVAEAIVQKNAIVSTDSDGGVKDMLIHNQTALVSQKNDADALAKNIEKVLTDENLRLQLSENAFQNLQKLSSENASEMWVFELFG